MAFGLAWSKQETGETYPDAYHKVLWYRMHEASIEIAVGVFKDRAAREDEKRPVEQLSFGFGGEDFTPFFALSVLEGAGVNPKKQCYLALKANSGIYATAQDLDPDPQS